MGLGEQAINRALQQGMKQGMKQGKQENSLDIALRMLRENVNDKFISKMTNLSLIEIDNLKKHVYADFID